MENQEIVRERSGKNYGKKFAKSVGTLYEEQDSLS